MHIFEVGKKACLGASAAAVLALGIQATAEASYISVRLTDGTVAGTVECADGASCDADPTTGSVTFVGTVGSWVVNVTTGSTYPLIGSIDHARLDLTNTSISGGTGTLHVLTSAVDYTGPISGGSSSMGVAIGGTTDGTVAANYYLDTSNALFGTSMPSAHLIDSLGPFSSVAFSASGGGTVASATPFSLTIDTVITHTSASQITTYDAIIPEPSLLGLMGAGLAGLGLLGLGRRSRQHRTMAA